MKIILSALLTVCLAGSAFASSLEQSKNESNVPFAEMTQMDALKAKIEAVIGRESTHGSGLSKASSGAAAEIPAIEKAKASDEIRIKKATIARGVGYVLGMASGAFVGAISGGMLGTVMGGPTGAAAGLFVGAVIGGSVMATLGADTAEDILEDLSN